MPTQLFCELLADNLVLADGADVLLWPDTAVAGPGGNWAPTAAAPKYKAAALNGRPSVRFYDGTDRNIRSPGGQPLGDYIGTGPYSHMVLLVFKTINITGNQGVVWGGPTFDLGLNLEFSTGKVIYDNVVSVTPSSLLTVNLIAAYHDSGAGQSGISVNGGSYVTGAAGDPADVTNRIQLGMSSAFYGDIGAFLIWGDGVDLTMLNSKVSEMLTRYGIARPGQQDPARATASRALRRRRREEQVYQVTAPLGRGLDVRLMDVVPLSHFAIPHPTGAAGGVRRWERVLCEVVSKQPQYSERRVQIGLRPLSDLLTTAWWLPRTGESGLVNQEGVVRLLAGSTWVAIRASADYVVHPADPGLIVEVPVDREPIGQYGCLFQGKRKNLFRNSAFRLGIASQWTKTGTVTDNTSDLLFDNAITEKSVTMAAGSIIEQTSESVSAFATSKFSLAIWRKDASASMAWSMQRGVDSKWLRASDKTWQNTEQNNPIPVSTTKGRYLFENFDVGATAGTIKTRIKANAGAASQVYQAQLEEGVFPSSEIVTDAAADFRQAFRLLVSHSVATGKPINNAVFTAGIRVRPLFNSADVAGLTFTFSWLPFDANNHIRWFYDGTAGAVKFERKVAGTLYTASLVTALTRDVPVDLGIRATSGEGELDLPAFTQSVFADDVKGTDVSSGAAPTEADGQLELGSQGLDTNPMWCWVEAYFATQQALRDDMWRLHF